MKEIYDMELAQIRELIRKDHTQLDQLMADGSGYELMKAMVRIETASKLFQQRLAELK
jgi:hypothetical protein